MASLAFSGDQLIWLRSAVSASRRLWPAAQQGTHLLTVCCVFCNKINLIILLNLNLISHESLAIQICLHLMFRLSIFLSCVWRLQRGHVFCILNAERDVSVAVIRDNQVIEFCTQILFRNFWCKCMSII